MQHTDNEPLVNTYSASEIAEAFGFSERQAAALEELWSRATCVDDAIMFLVCVRLAGPDLKRHVPPDEAEKDYDRILACFQLHLARDFGMFGGLQ